MGEVTQLPECPECARLHTVADKSQVCGEFLDWLQSQGIVLARWHEHSDECYGSNGFNTCGYRKEGDLEPDHTSTPSHLAKFFDIDMNKVEHERRALLEAMRVQQGGRTDAEDQVSK